MRPCRIFCILAFFILIGASAVAGDTPERILTEYLSRDARGERLSSEVSAHVDSLQVANGFEPAWDGATLIGGYDIKSIRQTGDSASASVLFKNAWSQARDFDPGDVRNSIVIVSLVKSGNSWKVCPPFYQPHVRATALQRYFEKLVREAKRDGIDTDYLSWAQSTLDSIRKYKMALQRPTALGKPMKHGK
jgi:hypothetical protein